MTQVRKVKSKRRIVGYVASIGPVDGGQRATSAEAKQACEKDMIFALERLDRGPRVFMWREHTIVVAPTLNGWAYWIDTFSCSAYTCHTNRVEREDAENDALHHLAQNLW